MNSAKMTTRQALQWAASAAATVGVSGLVAGCSTHVKVDPLEVKPITVNVNVNLRVQQELDKFFSFEDKLLTGDATTTTTRPTTASATTTTTPTPAAPPPAQGEATH